MTYEDPTFATSASAIPRMKVNVVENNDKPFFTVDEWYSPEELISVWKELDFYTDFKKLSYSEDQTLQLNLGDVYKEDNNISDILSFQYKEKLELFANQVQRSFTPEKLDEFLNIKSTKTIVRYFHNGMKQETNTHDSKFTSVCFLRKADTYDGGDMILEKFKVKDHNTRLVFFPSDYEYNIETILFKDATKMVGAGLYTITTYYY